MPYLRLYHIFISHPWTRTSEYDRLLNFLNSAYYLRWKNYSVPRYYPLDTNSDRELKNALHNQIKPTHIVLVLSGMYAHYRKWIQIEIDIANFYNKPIIGIKPWGQKITPQVVQSVAKTIVGWNTNSIVNAIRNYAK